MSRPAPDDPVTEWLRDLYQSDWTKLLLSTLIILSVLPLSWVNTYGLVFFAVFAIELVGRLRVLLSDYRHRSISKVEIAFFAIDTVATLSFLPMELLWDDIRFLRLLRLSRMLLLLGYWGPLVREIWTILSKRERRYQLFFAGVSVLIISFLSAILLFHFRARGIDFNEDGQPGNDTFWQMLWWSFRQVQDPGNLVKSADASLAFFCSLVLTIAGLFVFSFIIGIATSVVEELVKVGRERRLGVKRHSVICNIGPFSRVLLEELVVYYAKSLRAPKIVTMGPAPSRYSYMYEHPLTRIRYRQGQALSEHDLLKVDADRATRVILLGQRDRQESDAEVISKILSAREVSAARIYAELFRADNVPAALSAGGARTVPILADRMVSLFLAKIVAMPGMEQVYRDLLTSQGDEIYTCLFGEGAMEGRRPPSGPLPPFGELLVRGHRAHGVVLLGALMDDPRVRDGYGHWLNPGDDFPPPPDRLRGLFGLGTSFESVKDLVISLPDVAPPGQPAELPRMPRFALCPQACRVDRLLICGYHEGLVEFCEQLVLLTGARQLFIMVPTARQISTVQRAFAERPASSRPREGGRVVFRAGQAPGVLALHPVPAGSAQLSDDEPAPDSGPAPGDDPARDGEPAPGGAPALNGGPAPASDHGEAGPGRLPPACGELRVLVGDWSRQSSMLAQPEAGYQLSQMDAVLFAYSPGDQDPDARTAIGLLKLLDLPRRQELKLRPNLRVVCEVQSTEKARLFERRFGRAQGELGGGCRAISVVAAETMRNALLAQGVFVPGIDLIYRELLSDVGQEICKLLISPPPSEAQLLDFGQLLDVLYRRDGLLLLAVELEREGERTVFVNPGRKAEGYRFDARELVAVFVVGQRSRMRRAPRPCGSCRAG